MDGEVSSAFYLSTSNQIAQNLTQKNFSMTGYSPCNPKMKACHLSMQSKICTKSADEMPLTFVEVGLPNP
jgi:hypothetical protein